MKNKKIEEVVEVICHKGCQAVRHDIKKLEQSRHIIETIGLDREHRNAVLQELQSIMSVYGDSCSVDNTVEPAIKPIKRNITW